ncbi:hypothetical protein ACH5RR_010414 [Cinchona calisaya]|uniref:Uncharacterized protein n=1 Tax=Cinchona calisaya TaxID=153742 RepID=A0ABD3AIV3_9GENT
MAKLILSTFLILLALVFVAVLASAEGDILSKGAYNQEEFSNDGYIQNEYFGNGIEFTPEEGLKPNPQGALEPSPGHEQGIEPTPELGLKPEPRGDLEPSPGPEQGIEPTPEEGLKPDPRRDLEPSPGPEQGIESTLESVFKPDPQGISSLALDWNKELNQLRKDTKPRPEKKDAYQNNAI